MNSTTKELKAEAKKLGIAWSMIEETYRMIKAGEVASREYPNFVRQQCWLSWTVGQPGKETFWRCGFRNTLLARVNESDYTAIPSYDCFAKEMAEMFPEYQDKADKLWAFLLSPHRRMPSAKEMLRKAFDMVVRESKSERLDLVPF